MLREPLLNPLAAFAAATIVATLARRFRALDRGGAIAAVVVGTTIVLAGGWWWGVLLILFFVTSSALSRLGRQRRAAVESIAARGAERDAVQVFANGGVPAALALAAVSGHRALCYAAFAGAIAAVAADTWATEIGRRCESPPRLITTWRRVPRGTSGGISALGTTGAAVGAGLIALATAAGSAAGWAPPAENWPALLAVIAVAGFGGSLADSVLGATAQATYRCPRCDLLTELRVHVCGTATNLDRGVRFVNNDIVNVGAAVAGAAIAAALVTLV